MGRDDLEVAWNELHATTPRGWYGGRPSQRHGGQWAQYAFDPSERPKVFAKKSQSIWEEARHLVQSRLDARQRG